MSPKGDALSTASEPTCPICGAATRRTLRGLGRLARYPYRSCQGCGLVFALTDPVAEQRFYELVYPSLPHKRGESDGRRCLYLRSLDRLEALLGRGRVLDIGCGTGHFLATASTRGWTVLGQEVSLGSARAARKLGVPVMVGPLEAIAAGSRFDLITLWNVLDQAGDPKALARAAVSLLAPGGLLFARVPNGAFHRPLMRIMAKLPDRPAQHLASLSPLHPWLLRPRDLVSLLEAAGLDAVSVRITDLSGAGADGGRGLLDRAKALADPCSRWIARLSHDRLLLSPSIEATGRARLTA